MLKGLGGNPTLTKLSYPTDSMTLSAVGLNSMLVTCAQQPPVAVRHRADRTSKIATAGMHGCALHVAG